MTTSLLMLGEHVFEDFEIPEGLPFGTGQLSSTKKLMGGIRVVDAMGEDPGPKQWSGRFTGEGAMERALYIRRLTAAGAPLPLIWGRLAYTVLITLFEPVAESEFEIPYSITCEVISDDSAPPELGSGLTVDDMVGGDELQASLSAAEIGSPLLDVQMTAVDSALGQIRDLAGAGATALNTVLVPARKALAIIDRIQGAGEAVLGESLALGNVIPGLPISSLVLRLQNQTSEMIGATHLFEAENYLGRLARNLDAVGSSGAQRTMVGGDLYRAALDSYGDATEFNTIGQANGITDPILTGAVALLIPPRASGLGGVPNL